MKECQTFGSANNVICKQRGWSCTLVSRIAVPVRQFILGKYVTWYALITFEKVLPLRIERCHLHKMKFSCDANNKTFENLVKCP